jgi:hypothetical protein
MGKSSKQTTGPSKFAQPYIQSGANAVQSAYQGNQGNIANISQTLQSNMPAVLGQTLNNPTLAAANAYTQQTLNSDPASNPFLQQQIDLTNGQVANKVNASIGTRGGAGGSAQAQLLARELANNESTLRYNDYTAGLANKNAAVGQATAESAAGNNNIQALLAYLTGQATIPQSGANSYAGSIGSLLGQYNTTTKTPSVADSIGQGLGTALQVSSLFSDRRLKTEIRKVGEHSDGLGKYVWRYIWGGSLQEGVMADEVATLRPWALGPTVMGFATVNYEAL